nr:hypothetical protein [Treponema sp.]
NPQFEAGTISKGLIATQLFCDSYGRIWLLTANEKGLFCYKDGLFRTIRELDSYGNYFASAIGQDNEKSFWIGLGEHGIFKIQNDILEKVYTHTLLDHISSNTIYNSPDGVLWFGTEKGLVVYSDNSFYEYKGDILKSAKINKIISDREKNIWLATDKNGIGKLTHGKFKMNRLGVTVNSIAQAQDNKVWVGSDKGLFCYENDIEVTNELTEYTKGLRIRDVAVTDSGSILVSCYTKPGQILYDGKTIKSWSTDQGLAGNKVRVAIQGRKKELYVGTTTGLSIIHPDASVKNYKQVDGLENEYVMALYQDSNDIVWIGTDGGGIYLMKDEKIISNITSSNGLAGNVIFKIHQNKDDGAYWICSGSGITRCPNFNSNDGIPEIYENINSENGIETDSMFQILTDKNNSLWMTSNHGISSVDLSQFKELANKKITKVSVKFYNKNDGLDSIGPTATAKSMVDKQGRIWFAMIDGIAIYDPVNVNENPIRPLVQIEKIIVDDEVLMDHTLFHSENNPIILRPGTKRVDIQFTGFSFDSPERLTFVHKLSNFDKVFSSPSTARRISYTNLKAGKHTFTVNAINGDGFYSTQTEAVLFVQKPYFYQVPLFWVIVGLLLIGGVSFFFYIKQKRIKQENLRLEGMVRMRTAELTLEKEKSDELLRAILPSQIAVELKDGIHSIGQDFDEVTVLFTDIVEFTKTSSGHTAAEIVDALNDLFTLFDKRAQRSGVEKIKTIGDAYMATCGLPSPNPNHAEIMLEYAKGLLEDLEMYNQNAKIPFNIRIGLNSGPATAGVIGRTKFIYDVWGNTVNVASRMETAASPGSIRVSQALIDHLKEGKDKFKFSQPIECDIKGKGRMITYDVL